MGPEETKTKAGKLKNGAKRLSDEKQPGGKKKKNGRNKIRGQGFEFLRNHNK